MNSRLFFMVTVLAATLFISDLQGQQRQQANPNGNASKDLEVVQVRPNVYMIAGAGGNVVAQTGWQGVIVVDAGSEPMTDKLLAAIKRLTTETQRIRYIINTSADADHVGGNVGMARAGLSLYPPAGDDVGNFRTNGGGAAIMAHENVLNRMSAPTGQKSPFPSDAWPTETYTQKNRSIYLNGEGIQVFYQPAAHSDGDSIVFFRRSDVIITGDIFDTTRFPIIDLEKGGSIQGEIDALNHLLEMSIPAAPMVWHEDRTLLIPGHGRVCDQADLVEYRDMVTIIRDVIRDMKKRGMTLDQVKKADPAKGYRARYGTDPTWTTDMFVEAIFKSLTS
jgi:cyclase